MSTDPATTQHVDLRHTKDKRDKGPATKFLFLDSGTGDLVTSDGLVLIEPPGKTKLAGLGESLDQEEEEMHAYTGFENLVPALGFQKWDGHVYVSGATGSGKSYLINTMLMHDHRRRRVFLFTDHKKIDPSLKPMIEAKRMSIVRDAPDDSKKWEVSISEFIKDKKHSIIMFDDCTDPNALFMRDNALRKGRHSDTVVICVNHKLRDNLATKHALVNARWMVMFPSSNRGAAGAFMKDWMEMHPRARRSILRQSIRDGRQLIFHMQSPNVAATAKSIIKL